ncbi:hypothetical protein GCM10027195_07410 [Comamonas sediminis]
MAKKLPIAMAMRLKKDGGVLFMEAPTDTRQGAAALRGQGRGSCAAQAGGFKNGVCGKRRAWALQPAASPQNRGFYRLALCPRAMHQQAVDKHPGGQ